MSGSAFEILVALCAGIGLAAAAGIRAFLPLLAVSVGARLGLVDLNPGLDFLSSNVALVALVVATLVEIGADKIPIVDNMLDVVSTFLRPMAGFVAAMAMFGELPQPIAIVAALVMATVSLGTQLGRAKTRLGSTAATGGLANPLLSTAEDALSGTLSVLAIVVPILAGVAVIFLFWAIWKFIHSIRRFTAGAFGTRASREVETAEGIRIGDLSRHRTSGSAGSGCADPSGSGVGGPVPGRDRRRPEPKEIRPEP